MGWLSRRDCGLLIRLGGWACNPGWLFVVQQARERRRSLIVLIGAYTLQKGHEAHQNTQPL